MDVEKNMDLIDQYARSIQKKIEQNKFGKPMQEATIYEWAAGELRRTEKALKIVNPLSIGLIVLAMGCFLAVQFTFFALEKPNLFLNFFLAAIGFYFMVERYKIKTERLKTILFLKQINK